MPGPSLQGLLDLDDTAVQVTNDTHAQVSLTGGMRLSHNLDTTLPELLNLAINIIKDQGDPADRYGRPSEAGSRGPERASAINEFENIAIPGQKRVSWPSLQGNHGQPNKPEDLFIPA